MALLHGRAGRLTAQNGDLIWHGQYLASVLGMNGANPLESASCHGTHIHVHLSARSCHSLSRASRRGLWCLNGMAQWCACAAAKIVAIDASLKEMGDAWGKLSQGQ